MPSPPFFWVFHNCSQRHVERWLQATSTWRLDDHQRRTWPIKPVCREQRTSPSQPDDVDLLLPLNATPRLSHRHVERDLLVHLLDQAFNVLRAGHHVIDQGVNEPHACDGASGHGGFVCKHAQAFATTLDAVLM